MTDDPVDLDKHRGMARYLLQLFAATLDARDPRRRQLIAGTIEDLARLSGTTKEHP